MLALLLLPRLLPKPTDDIDDDDDDEAVDAAAAVVVAAPAVVIVVFVVFVKVVWTVLVVVVVLLVFEVVFAVTVFGRENKFFVSAVASPLSQTANAFKCFRLFFVFKKLPNSVFFPVRASFV